MTIQEWGEQLKQARLTAQMTIDDVSASTGINRANISKIENGIGNPTISTILRIIDVYGADVVIKVKDSQH